MFLDAVVVNDTNIKVVDPSVVWELDKSLKSLEPQLLVANNGSSERTMTRSAFRGSSFITP